MSLRTPEEHLSLTRIATVIAITIGAWLFYRHYNAAAERIKCGRDIAFGELRIVKEGVNPKFQIVAVQGLGSHPDRTWKSKEAANGEDTDLLLNLLPAHLKDARILQWIYNSDWEQDGTIASLQDFGEHLFYELNAHFERRKGQDDPLPVVFLGHSFGGLVIKEAFVAGESNNNDLWKITRGIIFLGTPHLGSSMSQIATLLAFFNRSLGSSAELVKALHLRSRRLEGLLYKFHERLVSHGLRTMPILSISETKPMYLFGLSIGRVVDSLSSQMHSSHLFKSACNHTELNKFTGVDDIRLQQLVKCIKLLIPSYILEVADERIRDSCYADDKLKVERLSGQKLDLNSCYINLGLVNMSLKDDNVKQSLGTEPPQHTLSRRLRLEEPEDTKKIELAKLFDPIKINDIEKLVTRVLIYGRAGIGKTTLCKKIVHEFKEGRLWRTRFDRLLWIPLRELIGLKGQAATLESVLERRFFPHDALLAQRTGEQLKLEKFNRTLLLLDGLDEVVSNLDDSTTPLLDYLIKSPNIIITSRPHIGLPTDMSPFDIEAEVVGLVLDQIDDYIEKSNYDSPDKIRKFLRMNKIVRDLARIPIQLEALCYTWNMEDSEWDEQKPPRSMTQLYQAMEIKLAQKDLERGKLQDQNNARGRSKGDIKKESTKFTNFLEALAFAGMCLGEVNFNNRFRDMISVHFGDQYCVEDTRILHGLSFLRSTSSPRNEKARDDASFHFLHLTYQEYFAAKYFVQQWLEEKLLVVLSSGRPPSRKHVTFEEFIQENKYLPAFDVFWRFVCGLLPESTQTEFFTLVSQRPDILGATHQRFIMHCLAEANPTFEVEYHLADKLGTWACFELCQGGYDNQLAEEAEFPESAIQRILPHTSFGNARTLLDMIPGRDSVSSSVLEEVFKLHVIHGEHTSTRAIGISILARCNLPKRCIATILESEGDADTEIVLATMEILAKQKLLHRLSPETLRRFAQEPAFSSHKARILRDCHSAELFHEYLRSWRQSEDGGLRLALIRSVCQSNLLDAEAREDLLKPHRDDDHQVQYLILHHLEFQDSLPDELLKFAVKLPEHHAVSNHRSDPFNYQLDNRESSPVEHARLRLLHRHGATLGPIYTHLLRYPPESRQLRLLRDLTPLAHQKIFDSLPSDVVDALRDLLGNNSREISQAALTILAAEESLDQNTLAMIMHELINGCLKDHPVPRFSNKLSSTFIRSLHPMLQHSEQNTRGRVIQILRCQPQIPNVVLKGLIPRSDDFYAIDLDTLALCRKFEDLPEDLEQSIVSLLDHSREDIQSKAGKLLGARSSLTPTSLESIANHLRSESGKVKLAAIEAVSGLKKLPDEICVIFCELLQKDKKTHFSICAALCEKDDLNREDLHRCLADVLADKSRRAVKKAIDIFQNPSVGKVSETTIARVLSRFRQWDSRQHPLLRVYIVKAMAFHISDSALAPKFISTLSKDVAEVQIAFLESVFFVRRPSPRICQVILPLFDRHYHAVIQHDHLQSLGSSQRLEILRCFMRQILDCPTSLFTDDIADKVAKLLYYDDPNIQKAAGGVLVTHGCEKYLDIFVPLLMDSDKDVRSMAYDALRSDSENQMSSSCVDALSTLLKNATRHNELTKRIIKILVIKKFDPGTQSARDMRQQVLRFLFYSEACGEAIEVLAKFNDLSGLDLGRMMLQVPDVRERCILLQLFLNRCNHEELEALLQDEFSTIPFCSTATQLAKKETLSMHFVDENKIQINMPTGIKTVRLQEPEIFLIQIQNFRDRFCEQKGIKKLSSVKRANILESKASFFS